jgi:hypothetical protein
MGDGNATGAMTSAVDTRKESVLPLPRRALERWKKAAHAIGVVQTRILMLGVYVTLVLPTGLVMRLFEDPLHLRPPGDGNWVPTRREKPTIETARRQF